MYHNELKYIIVDSFGIKIPIIFHAILEHKAVAGQMNVVSAGFCAYNIENKCWRVYGKSVGLGLSPNYNDGDILSGMIKIK